MISVNMLIKAGIIGFSSCHSSLPHDKIQKTAFPGATFTYQCPMLVLFKTKIEALENQCIVLADTDVTERKQKIIHKRYNKR